MGPAQLLADVVWYSLAAALSVAAFARHLFWGNAGIDKQTRRTLAGAKAIDLTGAVLSLWGGVSITLAVLGVIEFSELAQKKTPILVGAFWIFFYNVGKILGCFLDDLDGAKKEAQGNGG